MSAATSTEVLSTALDWPQMDTGSVLPPTSMDVTGGELLFGGAADILFGEDELMDMYTNATEGVGQTGEIGEAAMAHLLAVPPPPPVSPKDVEMTTDDSPQADGITSDPNVVPGMSPMGDGLGALRPNTSFNDFTQLELPSAPDKTDSGAAHGTNNCDSTPAASLSDVPVSVSSGQNGGITVAAESPSAVPVFVAAPKIIADVATLPSQAHYVAGSKTTSVSSDIAAKTNGKRKAEAVTDDVKQLVENPPLHVSKKSVVPPAVGTVHGQIVHEASNIASVSISAPVPQATIQPEGVTSGGATASPVEIPSSPVATTSNVVMTKPPAPKPATVAPVSVPTNNKRRKVMTPASTVGTGHVKKANAATRRAAAAEAVAQFAPLAQTQVAKIRQGASLLANANLGGGWVDNK